MKQYKISNKRQVNIDDCLPFYVIVVPRPDDEEENEGEVEAGRHIEIGALEGRVLDPVIENQANDEGAENQANDEGAVAEEEEVGLGLGHFQEIIVLDSDSEEQEVMEQEVIMLDDSDSDIEEQEIIVLSSDADTIDEPKDLDHEIFL